MKSGRRRERLANVVEAHVLALQLKKRAVPIFRERVRESERESDGESESESQSESEHNGSQNSLSPIQEAGRGRRGIEDLRPECRNLRSAPIPFLEAQRRGSVLADAQSTMKPADGHSHQVGQRAHIGLARPFHSRRHLFEQAFDVRRPSDFREPGQSEAQGLRVLLPLVSFPSCHHFTEALVADIATVLVQLGCGGRALFKPQDHLPLGFHLAQDEPLCFWLRLRGDQSGSFGRRAPKIQEVFQKLLCCTKVHSH